MATIAPTSMTGSAARTVNVTTLGASDTFVYKPGRGQILLLRNTTAGALTPNIDGANGTTVPVPGVGDVSVAAGYTTPSIPATTGVVAIPLDTISAYLQGVIAITGGSGILASLLEY